MWFVALQPGQEQPCDYFDHADIIVHMGKTIAQKGAHVFEDGIRHKDVYAISVGDNTKIYFIFFLELKPYISRHFIDIFFYFLQIFPHFVICFSPSPTA